MSDSNKVQVLNEKFEVVSYDGGMADEEFGIEQAFIQPRNPASVHCSDLGSNFNLVLKYNGDAGFVLTNFVARGGVNCTAPLKSGVVFVSEEEPKIDEYTKFYDNMTKQQFDALSAEEKKTKGNAVCFFETDENTLQDQVELPEWAKGKYVHVKFISAHSDESVDVAFLGLVGFDAASAPAPYKVGQVPEDLEITIKSLGKFNQIHPDFAEYISLQKSIIVFGDDKDEKFTKVKAMLGQLAESGQYNLYKGPEEEKKADEDDEEEAENDERKKKIDNRVINFYYLADSPSAPIQDHKFSEAVREHIGIEQGVLGVAALDLEPMKKYVLEGEITEESLKAFVEGIVNGTAKQFHKSQPRPENDADPNQPNVVVVTYESFQELVLDDKYDVLLDVYAPWAEPCQLLEPAVLYVASLMKEIAPSVRVCRIDSDKNDFDAKYVRETELPNIKLFPKGSKDKSVRCAEPSDCASLVNFIHENMQGEKFNLGAALKRVKKIDESIERRTKAQHMIREMEHIVSHLQPVMEPAAFTEMTEAAQKLKDVMANKDATGKAIEKAMTAVLEASGEAMDLHDSLHHAAQVVSQVSGDLRRYGSLLEDEQAALIRSKLDDLKALVTAKSPLSLDDLQDALQEIEDATSDFNEVIMEKEEAKKAEEEARHKKNVIVVTDSDHWNELSGKGDLGQGKLVVLDFTATWCGPCQYIAPIFGDLSEKYEGKALFYKIDVDQCSEVAGAFKVRAMPTFVFMRDGKELAGQRIQGADAKKLMAKVEELTKA